MDTTDLDKDRRAKRRAEEKRRREHNASLRWRTGGPPPKPGEIRRTRAQAQSAAYYRWTRMGSWSTLPYAVAPGTLLIGIRDEEK